MVRPGVSVCQTLEDLSGQEFLKKVLVIRDGDMRGAFSISSLALQLLIVVQHSIETMALFDATAMARVPFPNFSA
jgi:hypothetical protein